MFVQHGNGVPQQQHPIVFPAAHYGNQHQQQQQQPHMPPGLPVMQPQAFALATQQQQQQFQFTNPPPQQQQLYPPMAHNLVPAPSPWPAQQQVLHYSIPPTTNSMAAGGSSGGVFTSTQESLQQQHQQHQQQQNHQHHYRHHTSPAMGASGTLLAGATSFESSGVMSSMSASQAPAFAHAGLHTNPSLSTGGAQDGNPLYHAAGVASPTGAAASAVPSQQQQPQVIVRQTSDGAFSASGGVPNVGSSGPPAEPLILLNPSINGNPSPPTTVVIGLPASGAASAALNPGPPHDALIPSGRTSAGTTANQQRGGSEARDAAAVRQALGWGVEKLTSALASMSSATDPLPVRTLQDFRDMCEVKKATDSEIYTALRQGMAEAAFDAFLTLYERSPLPRCLLDDLTESRGVLWLAVFDACCANFAAASTSADEREKAARIGDMLLNPVRDLVAVLAASQRGCIALMRVVSATHHDPDLASAVLAEVIAPHARTLLVNERASYVLCHAINGLSPVPSSATAAASPLDAIGAVLADFAGRFAAVEDRATYLFDITGWAACGEQAASRIDETSAASPKPVQAPFRDLPLSSRALCRPAAWGTFVSAVCAALCAESTTVLRGRQQCFVMWHVLRRWPIFSIDAATDMLATYTSPRADVVWPPPAYPTTSGQLGITSASSSHAQHSMSIGSTSRRQVCMGRSFSASGERIASAAAAAGSMSASADSLGSASGGPLSPTASCHTPLNTLCRSTPGRCALSALLTAALAVARVQPDGAALDEDTATGVKLVVDAVRLLSVGGVPTVDKRLEATMKRRPGMEIARCVEDQIETLLTSDTATVTASALSLEERQQLVAGRHAQQHPPLPSCLPSATDDLIPTVTPA